MRTRAEATTIRHVAHGPAPGPWNMAVDHALMEEARRGRVTLRTYRWAPPCLSFGRNQRAHRRYGREEAARRGIDVVRRPTGGRAVFHHREVTYAVTAPADLWGGLRRSYARLNSALRRGLRRLGVAVETADERAGGRAPGPGPRACFRDPLPGEVTAGGRKLVGSAQWREDGALLQHGSVLLRDDQAVADDLRDGGGGRDVRAAALDELLDPVPEPGEVAAALAGGFAEELAGEVRPGELGPRERRRAERLAARYADAGWTWRR